MRAFNTHPLALAEYRSKTAASRVEPAYAYRCKRCKAEQYHVAGRKKHPVAGWICPACVAKSA